MRKRKVKRIGRGGCKSGNGGGKRVGNWKGAIQCDVTLNRTSSCSAQTKMLEEPTHGVFASGELTPTPMKYPQPLCAALALCAVMCVPLQVDAALRLVCDIDGRALEPVRIEQGRILLSDGIREIDAPKNARWRIEGGLRENADMLSFSPSYGIQESNGAQDDPDFDPEYTMIGSSSVIHEIVSPLPDRPAASSFLDAWPEGTKAEALLVSVWMLDGQPAHVHAEAIPASVTHSFARGTRFMLSREEARGQVLMLLWQPGGFVAPAKRFGSSVAQEAAVAAIFDDSAKLSELLKQGFNPASARTKGKFTLLHFAAEAGADRSLDVLLSAMPGLLESAGYGKCKETPLLWAVGKGRAGTVKKLLAAGANPNADLGDVDRFLTKDAVMHGHAEVLSLLLAAKGKIKGETLEVSSALELAIVGGGCKMAGLLCENQQLDNVMLSRLYNGEPLRFLLRDKKYDMVKWLLSRGFKIKRDIGTNPPVADTDTDLFSAAVLGYSVDRAHTDLRAILNMIPKSDEEAFADVLAGACPELIATERLRQNAADIRTRMGRWDASPMGEAALAGRLAFVRKLAEAGCAINEPLCAGRRALHYAAAGNAVDVAVWLIEKGASVDAPDIYGLTPLDVAIANGSLATARVLAGRGARLNPACAHAETLLVDAIRLDLPEVVIPAVGAGVAARSRTFSHWPPRRVAEFLEAAKCLAAWPSDDAVGNAKNTPVANARELDRRLAVTEKYVLRTCANPLESRTAITVCVKALVEPSGRIKICTLPGTEAPAALQKTALDAARQCKMADVFAGGRPAATWTTISVVFAGRNDSSDTGKIKRRVVSSVDPQLMRRVRGLYPPEEHRKNMEGSVLVGFVVAEDGSVGKDQIDIVCARTKNFASEVKAFVSLLKFTPAMYDDKPVRRRVLLPFAFQLDWK